MDGLIVMTSTATATLEITVFITIASGTESLMYEVGRTA
jgi:hypothetical protein